ncbi:MAG: transcription termination/antitermination protein NusA [Candidatus Vogelbacteria bacterium]|nr:transcription termination/antitermination protein NusA [Candidatus Vogelbacteria bacterium]
MLDLKAVRAALSQLEEERGLPREKVIEAIEMALAAAYKKDYGKKGQIIRSALDFDTGEVAFSQVKIVVDESMLKSETPSQETGAEDEIAIPRIPTPRAEGEEAKDERVYFNEEHHIMLDDARRIKTDAKLGDELVFPLEVKEDFGRIAAQTAKQVIIQRIREAEKSSVLSEFSGRQGTIVAGTVQRIEFGNVFVDLGRTIGILPREEQIPSEHYRQGERIKAYLYAVEETPRGVNLRLSRTHPQFITKLFEIEAPEIAEGAVVIENIAREPGSRTKIAVSSRDESIDPVGSCVGQRGVRVSTVISELGGEKIDIIEWSNVPEEFISHALSPAKISSITLNPNTREALVTVDEDQFSPAIGKGGQNVRLAARLTGWKIDIRSPKSESEIKPADSTSEKSTSEPTSKDEGATTKQEEPAIEVPDQNTVAPSA